MTNNGHGMSYFSVIVIGPADVVPEAQWVGAVDRAITVAVADYQNNNFASLHLPLLLLFTTPLASAPPPPSPALLSVVCVAHLLRRASFVSESLPGTPSSRTVTTIETQVPLSSLHFSYSPDLDRPRRSVRSAFFPLRSKGSTFRTTTSGLFADPHVPPRSTFLGPPKSPSGFQERV
ncbi:hypothetical protein N7532_005996 [Penicillium argentinense]|uniref:Uncharacterized protein n=1 Tax=Penicillium argentinense TaxID=1131581 RepID=A0A9W9FF92_9EURO|nr:uncharacterized protein N7532_005996 [Penicillium argentinense]KAJ5098995.1 hypothetical protein N7532_005996 [Penicillium argentinense]